MLTPTVSPLIIILSSLCRISANTAEWGFLSPNIRPITDFTLKQIDGKNKRKQNTGPWIEKGIEANSYNEYFEWQLERWGLNEDYEHVQRPAVVDSILFWSGGGGHGDYGPFISIVKDFADLKIPNLRLIVYKDKSLHEFTEHGLTPIKDTSLLKLDIIPLFIFISQVSTSLHNPLSDLRRYYERLSKRAPNEYPPELTEFGQKRIILFDCYWVPEFADKPLNKAYELIRQDQGNIEAILEIYDKTSFIAADKHITQYGYIEIRSAIIELLNRQDLANSPDMLVPTITPKGHNYDTEFEEKPYNDWRSSLNTDSRIIFISIGGGYSEARAMRQLDLAEYMRNTMYGEGYAFIIHLKDSEVGMDRNLLTRVKDLRKMGIFVLCGFMPLDRPFSDCSLVINHGGHGSVWRTLINGHMQLNLPIDCADQLQNALMIQDAKLGRVQAIPQFSDQVALESFLNTIKELCSDPDYDKNAKAFVHTYQDTEHNGNSAILIILTKLYLKMLSLRQRKEENKLRQREQYGEGYLGGLDPDELDRRIAIQIRNFWGQN